LPKKLFPSALCLVITTIFNTDLVNSNEISLIPFILTIDQNCLQELLNMPLKWKKLLLSVIAIAITINLMFSGTVLAVPNLNSPATFASVSKVIIATDASNYTFPEEDFTPQERQELQGVRQSRNREIWEILDESQRIQIEHNLRSGKDIHQAIAELDLQIDQWDMIQAIMEWSELKMKRIIYRHSPHKTS
jgi:hypothetical protein